MNLVAVAEGERPKTIPFRLVEPTFAFGNSFNGERLHRRKGRPQRQAHVRAWAHRYFSKRTLPVRASNGFQRSPTLRTRAGTLSMRKSSIRKPRSISRHVTGVDTGARCLGRTE